MDSLRTTTLTSLIVILLIANADGFRFFSARGATRFKPPRRTPSRVSGHSKHARTEQAELGPDLANFGDGIGDFNYHISEGNTRDTKDNPNGNGNSYRNSNSNNSGSSSYSKEISVEESTVKPEVKEQQQLKQQQQHLQHHPGGRGAKETANTTGDAASQTGSRPGTGRAGEKAPETGPSTTSRTARSTGGKRGKKKGLRSRSSRRNNGGFNKAFDATVSAADKFFNPDGLNLDYDYNDYDYDYQQPRGQQQFQTNHPVQGPGQRQVQTYQQKTIIPPERKPSVTLTHLRKLAAEHDLELDEDVWDELAYGGSGFGTGTLIMIILWRAGILDRLHGCLCKKNNNNNSDNHVTNLPLTNRLRDSQISIACTTAIVNDDPTSTTKGRYSGGTCIDE